jgi:3-oxosteroid 1-dehydrogenase
MTGWDEVVDFLIIGSGGGSMCAALVCKEMGKTPLILEKEDKVGGSTAMSGGILWIPANPVMVRAGVKDSYEQGLAYLDALVGDKPSSTPARKHAYLSTGPELVEWLNAKGVPFVYCDGWSDYYDELVGGQPRGRSVGMKLFDLRHLGSWKDRLRRGPFPFPIQGNEVQRLTLAKRTRSGFLLATRVGWRMLMMRLFRRELVGSGAAAQGWMLYTALRAGVDIRASAPVVDFVVENKRVAGVIAKQSGKSVRIQARDGVLINAGGFAHNPDMRLQFGPRPASTEWTHANPGDTGEMIAAAMRLGADVDCMDQAIWLVTSLLPNGQRAIHGNELGKPHAILVDNQGKRFTNESCSYMETGQNIYRHGAVPCWAIIESRHRTQYNWARMPPGINRPDWIRAGYMKRADTLEELANLSGIDPAGLKTTVARFNELVARGRDLDFKRGDRAYDRSWGDPTYKPNPCLGAIERPPFYAVALYPGDVGTFGGLMTDEHARVLRADGSPIEGLYATGNSTASVMADKYPGAGASIAASFIFGYRAARHASGANTD